VITIGTRGSDLATTQSGQVAASLLALGHSSCLQIIQTQGDRVQDKAFTQMAGKGFFTKEIEEALRAGAVDLAVHSLKDLPTEAVPGLQVVAIPQRQDPRDCLIVLPHAYAAGAAGLPLVPGAHVGTSAVRRVAQLKDLRADLRVSDLRGNVPTRLRRLKEGRFDAIVLAQAGLNRLQLDLQGTVAIPLSPTVFVPAPGQGALALQARCDDAPLQHKVLPLHAAADAACVDAERLLLAHVEGGCHAPLGAHAVHLAQGMQMHLFYGPKGCAPVRACVHGTTPQALLAAALLALQGFFGGAQGRCVGAAGEPAAQQGNL
jgi:hydroxymethylbilane synthase